MRLILALSVIILHHVDSYSCRSILRKLDDFHPKSAEDSGESFELKNDEVMELLQPFMKQGQAETPKIQQLHKNFAKLTIEPYLERNQTHQWQRNPYNRFNKRKTMTPLAIILTHLPDLKQKQTQDNMQKNNVIDKSHNIKNENNDLYSNSRLTTQKTQYHPQKNNRVEQNSEEVKNINANKHENRDSDIISFIQKPYELNLDNSNILKQDISETSTKKDILDSKYLISREDQDLSDLGDNKKDDDYSDVQSNIEVTTDQFMEGNGLVQIKRPLEHNESNKDEAVLNDSTHHSTDLNYKYMSDIADDKIQDSFIAVSAEGRNLIAQGRKQSRESDEQSQDIEITEKHQPEDSSEGIYNKLESSNVDSEENIWEIKNTKPIIVETEEPRSKEDVTESSLTYQEIPLNNLQKYDLKTYEETRQAKDIDNLKFQHQNNVHSYEDQTVRESDEKLSKEHVIEYSNGNHHKKLYKMEDDPYLDASKELSEEPLEQFALIGSLKHPLDKEQHTVPKTDVEIRNEDRAEDLLNGQDKHIHGSEVAHKGLKHWHQDMHNRRRPRNIYNLCFHFNR